MHELSQVIQNGRKNKIKELLIKGKANLETQ